MAYVVKKHTFLLLLPSQVLSLWWEHMAHSQQQPVKLSGLTHMAIT